MNLQKWFSQQVDNVITAVVVGVQAFRESWDASDELEYVLTRLDDYEKDGYWLVKTYGPECDACGCGMNASSVAISTVEDELNRIHRKI